MTRITHTIILTVVAIILALPLHSLAEDDYYYGADDDRIALSEERAEEVAEEAVSKLLKASKKKMSALLNTRPVKKKRPKPKRKAAKSSYIADDFVKESPRGSAANIVSIESRSSRKATLVAVSGDGRIGKYNSFTLDSPTRLVVDISGVGSTLSNRTLSIDIDSEFVDKVRVGAHPGKVRLVFDSSLANLPKHDLRISRGNLIITFGSNAQSAEEEPYNDFDEPYDEDEYNDDLGSGDMLRAITICAIDAPEMTKRFTDKTGYRFKRVSLKVRNPDNTPDYYERQILWELEDLKEEGKLKKSTIHSRVVDQDGGRYLRYMKPLVIQRPCLNCHGRKREIPKDVRRFIKRFYPDDEATGYRVGDVRGAVSVKIPIIVEPFNAYSTEEEQDFQP